MATPTAIVSIHASVKDATLHLSSHHRRPEVSIHASVKDATLSDEMAKQLIEVSIHASVKDATLRCFSYFLLSGFNPRICKRCDSSVLTKDVFFNVSIHASVKDATDRT